MTKHNGWRLKNATSINIREPMLFLPWDKSLPLSEAWVKSRRVSIRHKSRGYEDGMSNGAIKRAAKGQLSRKAKRRALLEQKKAA